MANTTGSLNTVTGIAGNMSRSPPGCFWMKAVGYSYGNDAYFLRPPMNFNEFVEEGAELMHCVASAGYFCGHVEGKSYIFLVRTREDPDTAFFTMQYNPQNRTVNQLRGYKDKGATEEVVSFPRRVWLASMGVMPAKKAA